MLEIKPLESNINTVALVILHLLEGEVSLEHEPWTTNDNFSRFYITTSTFYNGRERGICLTIAFHFGKPNLAIVFGEHRNSDMIFIDHWLVEPRINPPTVADFTDEAYEQRRYMQYDEVYKAATYIRELIESYCIKCLQEVK